MNLNLMDQEGIFKSLKKFFKVFQLFLKAYVWCIVFVMFLYFTHQAQIHLPLVYSLQEGVALSKNRIDIVNFFYFVVVFVITLSWGIKFIFKQRNYVNTRNLIFFRNRKNFKK